MMKLLCDRCGKEINFNNDLYTSISVYSRGEQKSEELSLCPACAPEVKELLNLMKQEVVNEL